ncbi:tetratricopeptide repeat protein [Mucilaginibacter lutimaris]|uniref:Tetratricopeptide repeat protein n=1 Tax=Mucilaginibacter lutimaris TaxID=931629 RepID=A0ABW2ZGM2_9SPHI
MKFLCYLILLLTSQMVCYAQQTTKADDALLLDYYQNQRFAEAADYLKKTYPEPVNSTKTLGQLAYTSNMAGRLADAEAYYQRIYNIDATNTPVLYSLGSLNLRRGNNARAELYFKRIIARDSTNFMVFKQLATISHDKNDMTMYIAYLQRANRLNPTEPDVASDLSGIYISMKFTTQAEKVLTAAITSDPENIVLLNSLMKLQYAQKKWPETITTCLKLVDNGDRSGSVLSRLGVSYYNIKKYECALDALLRIEEISQSENSYYYTGLTYKAVKDQNMAIFYLQKAITEGISPNTGAYYGEVADSNEKLHKFKKAIAAYQKSLEFDESPMIYYSLANVYDTNLKDKKSAIKYYKKYLAGKPPIEKQKGFIDYSKSRIAVLSK